MAKKITKKINSQFNPTFVGSYPIYAWGGPMQYGFGSWLKSNAGNLAQTALGAGAMFVPGLQGVGTGLLTSGIGGMATTGDSIGNQQQVLQQQQEEALKSQMIDNLPAQHDYNPTFAYGGGLSRSKDYGSKKKPYPSVKSGDFAGGDRSYPIPTKADAIDALRLAGLHGRSDVRAKVFKKYPGLKKEFGGLLNPYSDVAAEGSFKYGGSLKGAPQGKATKKDIELFKKRYPQEMEMGTTVEYEHTQNRALAERIAADHIKDFEKMYGTAGYYQGLKEHGLTDELAYGGILNSYAGGGYMKQGGGYVGDLDNTSVINNGGTHEQSSLGGVPIGKNALVEEGEYIWEGPKGKYVFSNRF